MNTNSAAVGIVLAALLSCSEAEKRVGNARGVLPDRSLTPEEYIRVGLPAHDRPWSGADMARAERVLSALAAKDPSQLPRYQSERSGAVFARIVADDNLGFSRNRSLPLEARMPDAMEYFRSSNAVTKLYAAALSTGAITGAELVELIGSTLRTSVVALQLIAEFLPTLDKNDPTYPVRMEGLQQFREGLAITVAGTLQTLTERNAYEAPALKRLLAYMQQTLPAILPELPAGSRLETVVRLRSFRDDEKMADLRPDLVGLLRVVEGAAR